MPEPRDPAPDDGEAPVLVLCAMDEEAAAFLPAGGAQAPTPLPCPLAGVEAHRTRLSGRAVVVVRSGIGLASAAAAASWAICALRPRLVVSAGTAGGLDRQIEAGDVAIGESYSYGAADASEFGYVRGQVPGQPPRFTADPGLLAAARAARAPAASALRFGRILSSDAFVTARNVADTREAFPDAVATDMESCAIAQTARAFGIGFLSVRGISDLCGPEAGRDFHVALDVAAARSRETVEAVLAALPAGSVRG